MVNNAIKADVEITCEEMSVEDAKAQGAVGLFSQKYGEKVKVYTMGEYSKEICGGPHAKRTGELGKFKIVKEQSSSSGVRRIKAILEYTNKVPELMSISSLVITKPGGLTVTECLASKLPIIIINPIP